MVKMSDTPELLDIRRFIPCECTPAAPCHILCPQNKNIACDAYFSSSVNWTSESMPYLWAVLDATKYSDTCTGDCSNCPDYLPCTQAQHVLEELYDEL